MKKELHVKNHYVPECYLKRWADSEQKIFVYRTLVAHSNVPTWKAHSISAIAYQKHLYTQIVSGQESDEFELWLDKEFESPASEALDKAARGHPLSRSDWKKLINFLAVQDIRTPAKLFEHIQKMHVELQGILDGIMDDLRIKLTGGNSEDSKNTEPPSSADSFPLKITKRVEEGAEFCTLEAETYVGRSTWLHSMRYILNHTTKVLHSHKWTIVKPAKGHYWPTSDNPVVKINYSSPGIYNLKGGWNIKNGNIFFPIDPEHAMFTQIGTESIPKNTRLPEPLTLELKGFIAENSHRQIFSQYIDNAIPILKKRIIAPEILHQEKEEMNKWHQLNADMEREYIKSNRNT